MPVGDNTFSAVASLPPCVLCFCDASHVGRSADLTASDASGAVETPLRMCIRGDESSVSDVLFFSPRALLGMRLKPAIYPLGRRSKETWLWKEFDMNIFIKG